MSNAGQAFSAVAGAVVGFVASGGNPMGAAYGFQAGLLAGTQLFPTQLPHVYGPRMEDLTTTSAQLGEPIPIIYGTIAVPGFVMYLGCPREVSTTEELGGKGGGTEQSTTTYSYYQTIALGLCEGEIAGIYRIWENGELKYDTRPQQAGEADADYTTRLATSAEYAQTFELYLGDEDQLPDPTIETELGAGQVPGFRGLAYLVYPDRQLLDTQARRHPQWRVEVYKTASAGQQIVQSTDLTLGSDGWKSEPISVDWVRGRFFTTDEVGDNYIRAYRIDDNTEYAQIAQADVQPYNNLEILWHQTTGLDGNVYLCTTCLNGNTITIIQLEPETLTRLQYADFAGATLFNLMAWEITVSVRQYGVEGNRDYIVAGTIVTDDVSVMACEDLSIAQSQTMTQGEIIVGRGTVDGTTSYAWAINWTIALSGTSPAADIWRITMAETWTGIAYEPTVTFELYAQLYPSDVDPTWSRWLRIEGLVFDQDDDCLIFGVDGEVAAAGGGNHGRILKWNPATLLIEWQTAEDVVDLVNYQANHAQSRLIDGRYGRTGGAFDAQVIDTETGDVTIYDFFGESTGAFTGEELYDSTRNAIVTFANASNGPIVVYFDRQIAQPVSLAEIVSDVWDRCGGDAADIDVTDLESRYVNGYAITRPMPGRGAIEALRPLGPFDAVESGGDLVFPTRGKAIVATLTTDDLGVVEDGAQYLPAVRRTEKQDVDLPRQVRLRYIATSRDYEQGEQLSTVRFTTEAVGDSDVDIPVAIDDDAAMQTAEIIWAEAWASRWQFEASVDLKWLKLDPADCIGIPFDGRVHRARIVSIDDSAGGLLRKLQLLRDDDGIYTSTAIADVPARGTTTVVVLSESAMILLDLPPLVDADDDPGFYAACYRSNTAGTWGGAHIYRSNDGGATYSITTSTSNEATVARLRADLPTGITSTWDDANTIEVTLLTGELSSVTDAEILENSANALAIGAHGRWEIVQFGVATQISGTTWELSHLLRGRRATEHNVGLGVTGDYAVLLTTGCVRLIMQSTDIGIEKTYKAVTVGMTFASGTAQAFTGDGESLKPFSPVQIAGTRDGSNNLTITWVRRGRFGYSMTSGVDVPLSEASESYEVDVMDPGSPETVLRTITAASETAAYAAVDQTGDGLTPGDPITVRVYQMSATVGRGHYGEATI